MAVPVRLPVPARSGPATATRLVGPRAARSPRPRVPRTVRRAPGDSARYCAVKGSGRIRGGGRPFEYDARAAEFTMNCRRLPGHGRRGGEAMTTPITAWWGCLDLSLVSAQGFPPECTSSSHRWCLVALVKPFLGDGPWAGVEVTLKEMSGLGRPMVQHHATGLGEMPRCDQHFCKQRLILLPLESCPH
jgi:hypothetical protein